MTESWWYALLSVVIVSLVSFVGLVYLSFARHKLKNSLIFMVSFAAGALFGDAFIHLIPSATEASGFSLSISLAVILGIIVSFIVEKVIHWRHCHIHLKQHIKPYAIMNLLGDGIHNFLDGLTIGVSYLASIPVGIATTIAVIVHEIPQEIGDIGVLLQAGLTKKKALTYNFLTALTAIAGAIVSLAISRYIEAFITLLVPFAAGGFIYIAGADLIPEIHKEVETRKSLLQFLAFVMGIGIMLLLLIIE